eukprot:2356569-Pyramimonas_sp.AAC.1
MGCPLGVVSDSIDSRPFVDLGSSRKMAGDATMSYGSYGHPSCKDAILVGTAPWLPEIAFGGAPASERSAAPKAKPRPRLQAKKADQVRGAAKLTTEVVKHGKKK